MSWQISEYSLTLKLASKPIPYFVNLKFETAIKYFQKDTEFIEICKVLKLASENNANLKNLTYSKKELSITLGFSSICNFNVFKEALDDLEASIATKKE